MPVWYEYPNWDKHLVVDISTFDDYVTYRSCDMELGDIDEDGDPDILMKPLPSQCPPEDVLLNQGSQKMSLDKGKRHAIADLPDRAVFVQDADMDSDGHPDLIDKKNLSRQPGDNNIIVGLSITVPSQRPQLVQSDLPRRTVHKAHVDGPTVPV